MRHYEIVLLVHPDQSEQVPAMLGRYKEMITAEKGRVHRVEDWGRRRLAYMIDDIHKAHYVMLNIECDLALLRELEKNFKFNDSIVRNLVIRRDRAITDESAMAKAKAEEERAEAEKQARGSDGGDDGHEVAGDIAKPSAKAIDKPTAKAKADAKADAKAKSDKGAKSSKSSKSSSKSTAKSEEDK